MDDTAVFLVIIIISLPKILEDKIKNIGRSDFTRKNVDTTFPWGLMKNYPPQLHL